MEQYQIEKLDEFRERKVFSPFLFIIVNFDFIYTGKIMKHVLIKEQRYKIRYSYFDEWYYMSFWDDWKYEWEFVEFIK